MKHKKTLWKTGDFIKCQDSLRPFTIYWVGLVLKLVNYGMYKDYTTNGVDIVLSHIDGYMIACNFNNDPNNQLQKFNPTYEQYNKIKKATHECFEKGQIDNLSYILALDKFKKMDKKFNKINSNKRLEKSTQSTCKTSKGMI